MIIHAFQRIPYIIILYRKITIIVVGRLYLVGIQSTIGNFGRFIAIIHLFNKDGSIIAFSLNLVSHALFIHDTPKIVLSIHANDVVPASHIFVDSIIVFSRQIHRLSYIQETRNHISLSTTMSRRIGRKLLSQSLIRREEESLSLHLIFKPHDKADTFLLLKGIELSTSSMPNHHRFAILIHHLGGIFRVIFPITKPVLEVGSTDSYPLFCIQFGLLTIRSSHIGSVCLGIRHNLFFLFFQRETDIVATIDSFIEGTTAVTFLVRVVVIHWQTCILYTFAYIFAQVIRNHSGSKLVETKRSVVLSLKVRTLQFCPYCILQSIQFLHEGRSKGNTILFLGILLRIRL